MAHFAEVKDGIVQRVIVASREFINSGAVGDPANWIQTSYNTSAGQYTRGSTENEKLSLKTSGTEADKLARNRKNYAGIGYAYDKDLDAFIPPQPHKSWTLDKETCQWIAPKEYPADGKQYRWDEDKQDWIISEL